MTIDVAVLRTEIEALGFNLVDIQSLKFYITKSVKGDTHSFNVADIHKVEPHIWRVDAYFHHKMRPKEQEELIELLKKYGTRGD